jgi:hypothetical protein
MNIHVYTGYLLCSGRRGNKQTQVTFLNLSKVMENKEKVLPRQNHQKDLELMRSTIVRLTNLSEQNL